MPQLRLLVSKSVQTPPQFVSPVEHPMMHVPPLHCSPAAQRVPHVPQLRGSVWVSVQRLLQLVSPLGHWHVPPAHVDPDEHT